MSYGLLVSRDGGRSYGVLASRRPAAVPQEREARGGRKRNVLVAPPATRNGNCGVKRLGRFHRRGWLTGVYR